MASESCSFVLLNDSLQCLCYPKTFSDPFAGFASVCNSDASTNTHTVVVANEAPLQLH